MTRSLVVGIALAIAAALPAKAEERILRFISDVAIERNGDLDVTETIRVQAEGYEIRHGILRDFPTRYTDTNGNPVTVGFSVQSVTRDGAAEPFSTEPFGNGERIRIGSADTLVPFGPHDYVIRYRTTRQIGYFAGYDELYWNATGTGWTFPIDVAEAVIRLPKAVPFGNTSLYTGPQGARGSDATIITNEPGRIVFRTTEPLPAGSGLTVAAAFPKDVVDPPSATRRTLWWITDNLGALFAIPGSALALLYFIYAWYKVGRDPQHGTLVPLFSPPDGLSAAATRYVAEMGFDNRAFTAAILDLGVRGHIGLADSGSTLVLSRKSGGRPIGAPEQAAEAAIFKRSASVPLVQSNHAVLSAAQSELSRGLAKAYAGSIFHWNSVWLTLGVIITLLAYALTAVGIFVAMGNEQGTTAFIGLVFSSVGGIVVGILLNMGQTGRSIFSRLASWLFFGIFALGFGLAGIGALITSMRGPLDAAPLLLPLVVMPVLISSFSWMRSPTPEGQAIRDQIAGFRHYLGVAEEHRLEILHPPEKTPELFERYLPYAVALDVENAWAAKFADILASAGAAAAVAHWYATSSNRDPGSLVDRLGTGLSRTIASASTAPGSSSGSSGGGSSGGGGGGGGGSGW